MLSSRRPTQSSPQVGLLNVGDVPTEETTRRAVAAERLGYSYFWIGDERFFREPYQLLALVAAETSRVLVGPCVTDPFTRHPALTAEAMVTLAELSGSRAILVLGAGKSGFREMGITPRRSVLRIREAVYLIRRLLEGGPVTFVGQTVVFQDGLLNTLPGVTFPIWIATEGPRTLELAGEIADVVMIGSAATLTAVQEAAARVALGAERAGRVAPPLHLRLDVAIHDNPERAVNRARSTVLRHLIRHERDEAFIKAHELNSSLVNSLRGIDYKGFSRDRERLAEWTELVPDDLIGKFCWAGTIPDISVAWTELSALVDGVTVYPMLCEDQTWDQAITKIAAALNLSPSIPVEGSSAEISRKSRLR